MNRRALLTRLIQAGGLVVAGVVGIPALLLGLSPAREGRERPRWQRVGALAGFPVGETTEAVVTLPSLDWGLKPQRQAVYVWRPSESEIVVFSRACTDLGCPVRWDKGAEVFFCPCHGGIFARDGERMAGPPKRPLYRYAQRVVGGALEIDLASVPPMV